MPRVSRTRTVAASPSKVWDLVSDPHNLPRWWPKVMRVEDVTGHGNRARWTSVLQTDRGTGVRADFRCTVFNTELRFAWSQDVVDTPFERILKASEMSIDLGAADGESTEITLGSDESLRGLSRLGSGMMRGAARRRLGEALDNIEFALVGEPES